MFRKAACILMIVLVLFSAEKSSAEGCESNIAGPSVTSFMVGAVFLSIGNSGTWEKLCCSEQKKNHSKESCIGVANLTGNFTCLNSKNNCVAKTTAHPKGDIVVCRNNDGNYFKPYDVVDPVGAALLFSGMPLLIFGSAGVIVSLVSHYNQKGYQNL